MPPSHSGSAPRKRRAAGVFTLILAMALAALFILVAPVLAQNQDPPATPTGLRGEADHEWVALRWSDPGDDTITGYQVLRRNPAVDAQGVFHIHVEDTGSAATEYVDRMDVEPETTYVYRIKARNAAGLSARSDHFAALTPEAPPPGSPATPNGLTGEVHPYHVTLSWDDPEDADITGYQVLRRNKSVDGVGVFHIIEEDTGSAATEYVDLDVEPETPYSYRIKARSAVGLSLWSLWFDARTPEARRGVTITPTELTIDEGTSETYTVVLDTPPTEDVTVTADKGRTLKITVEPASLTFMTENWRVPQTVTVTGESDNDADDLTLIHRRTACRRPAEETKGCASESGIMVLKQKTGPRKGAPDRC